MKTSLLSLVVPLLFTASFANAIQGPGDAGGGDACERRIQEIRDDIFHWIQEGEAVRLQNLPVPVETYASRMTEYLLTKKQPNGAVKPVTEIECIDKPVEVQGRQKVCRFDKFETGPKITCQTNAFVGTNPISADEQYRLIHHEYAGLAGLEVPSDSQSTYGISDQLVAFLENQVVKRLAIHGLARRSSVKSDFCVSKIEGGEYFSSFFYRTSCTNMPKSFTTSGSKRSGQSAREQLTSDLKQKNFSLAGNYFFGALPVHVTQPSGEYCVLVLGEAPWGAVETELNFLDCGDGTLLNVRRDMTDKYLAKNGYQLVYTHGTKLGVPTGAHTTYGTIRVYNRIER